VKERSEGKKEGCLRNIASDISVLQHRGAFIVVVVILLIVADAAAIVATHHHHQDKILIINLSVVVAFGLADHSLDLVVGELLFQTEVKPEVHKLVVRHDLRSSVTDIPVRNIDMQSVARYSVIQGCYS
jgi:hypothetical protein